MRWSYQGIAKQSKGYCDGNRIASLRPTFLPHTTLPQGMLRQSYRVNAADLGSVLDSWHPMILFQIIKFTHIKVFAVVQQPVPVCKAGVQVGLQGHWMAFT